MWPVKIGNVKLWKTLVSLIYKKRCQLLQTTEVSEKVSSTVFSRRRICLLPLYHLESSVHSASLKASQLGQPVKGYTDADFHSTVNISSFHYITKKRLLLNIFPLYMNLIIFSLGIILKTQNKFVPLTCFVCTMKFILLSPLCIWKYWSACPSCHMNVPYSKLMRRT